MPLSLNQETVISAGNSTTTLLGPSGVFTGTSTEVLAFSGVRIFARQSGGKSAILGLKLQWSHDGTTFRDYDPDKFTVFDSTVRSIIRPIRARFFRISYTNGANAQLGFQLQTILVSEGDSTETIETETRILPAQERSGRVGVTGSIANTNAASTTLISAQGGRLYIKTLVISAINNDADANADIRIRDASIDKLTFLLPRQALVSGQPSFAHAIDFGDTPMTFNTSVKIDIVGGAGLARVSAAAHGYEEFLI